MTTPVSPLIIKGLIDMIEGTAVAVTHKEQTINWDDGMIRHMPMQTQIHLRKAGLDATVLLAGNHNIPANSTITIYKPNVAWHAGCRFERETSLRISPTGINEVIRAFRIDAGQRRFYAPEYDHHVQQLYIELRT